MHLESGAHCGARILFAGFLQPPDCHYSIAQVLINITAAFGDDMVNLLPQEAQQVLDIFRCKACWQLRQQEA